MRNFLRIMGGSVGLTSKTAFSLNSIPKLTDNSPVSGAILNNVLKSSLSDILANDTINQIASSVHVLDSLYLSPAQSEAVIDAYMKGMHTIFIMYAPIVGICFLCAVCIRDEGVAEKDAKPEAPTIKQG